MIDTSQYRGVSLGCGLIRQDHDILHVDIRQTPVVDHVVDLDVYPWPFPDSAFELIIANDIVEHVDDAIHFMEEVWRIGRPNALIHVRGPYHGHPQAYRAMDHQRYLALDSMDLFVKNSEYWKGYSYYTRVRFIKLEAFYYGAEICWRLQKDTTDDGEWEVPPHG